MRRLSLFVVLLGGISFCCAQDSQRKPNPLDGAKVKSKPGIGYRVETDNLSDSYTLHPRYGSDRYRIENDRNPSDGYTVKPRWNGSYQIESDRNPNETYRMKARWDGSYRIESDSMELSRPRNSIDEYGARRNPDPLDSSYKRQDSNRINDPNGPSQNQTRWDDLWNKNDRKKKDPWDY